MKIQKTDIIKYKKIPIGQATDLTNKKINRLTGLYRVQVANKKGAYWLFKCDCGEYCICLGQNVIQQKTKSCGCYRAEKGKESMLKIKNKNKTPWNKKDLTGQQFGEWTVLKLDEKGGDKHHRKWICQCSCGKIASVYGCNLGRISLSCGHARHYSRGEEKIKQILNNYKIPYETEKVMFYYEGNKKRGARFDFYIDNKYLIEYDGTTHYIPIGGWNNEEAIKEQQKRDQIKNEWCLKNNVPLIRIPYTHLKNITIDDLKLETSKFIIQKKGE